MSSQKTTISPSRARVYDASHRESLRGIDVQTAIRHANRSELSKKGCDRRSRVHQRRCERVCVTQAGKRPERSSEARSLRTGASDVRHGPARRVEVQFHPC